MLIEITMIKFFNRFKALVTNDREFFGDSPVSFACICVSKLNRKLAMFFLNHKIRKNGVQNWSELFFRNNPLMFCLPVSKLKVRRFRRRNCFQEKRVFWWRGQGRARFRARLSCA